MSALDVSGVLAELAAKLQGAADVHPAMPFDGHVSLPIWLAESARAQADRVFLVLDGASAEPRDLAWGKRLLDDSAMAFVGAWAHLMLAFGTGREPWAQEAAEAAGQAYADRLKELMPGFHTGGRA